MWPRSEPIWLLDFGPKKREGPKGDKKNSAQKFHSEAEIKKGTRRKPRRGPGLRRFGAKTSGMGGVRGRGGGGERVFEEDFWRFGIFDGFAFRVDFVDVLQGFGFLGGGSEVIFDDFWAGSGIWGGSESAVSIESPFFIPSFP